MEAALSLSMTAYLTACSRASDVELSRDVFAKLWIPSEAWQDHTAYLEAVSPWETQLLCLRNRFFLESLSSLFGNAGGLLINFGAGLSSYPYLLNEDVATIEIDSKELSLAKQANVAALLRDRRLPLRDIHYLGMDLHEKDLTKRIESLVAHSPHRKTYFLLEGILYYLKPSTIHNIFSWIDGLKAPSKQVGLVYWPNTMKNSPFVKSYGHFLSRRYQKTPEFTFLDKQTFCDSLPSLREISASNYASLAHRYNLTPRFPSSSDIFGEEFLVFS